MPGAVVVNGGGILHLVIHWQKDGLMKDILNNCQAIHSKIVNISDEDIIDCYYKNSKS